MSYISLKEKSRYLKEIVKGAGKDLREDETLACEEWADVYIEGKLCKSWDVEDYPTLIVRIADMLASSMAWTYLHSGQSPKTSEYAEKLKAQADGILDDILAGKMGLKLPDGSWDSDYPGMRNQEEKEAGDFEIIL